LIAAGALFVLNVGQTNAQTGQAIVPKDGFVPDEATAAKVAEAVLARIYGQPDIDVQKPFAISLTDGVWIVRGQIPRHLLGEAVEIRIRKRDGAVLEVSAGR
jgi:NTF2 fold immunity protein of polymorphic toxin system component